MQQLYPGALESPVSFGRGTLGSTRNNFDRRSGCSQWITHAQWAMCESHLPASSRDPRRHHCASLLEILYHFPPLLSAFRTEGSGDQPSGGQKKEKILSPENAASKHNLQLKNAAKGLPYSKPDISPYGQVGTVPAPVRKSRTE